MTRVAAAAPPALVAYRLASAALAPIAPLWLAVRARRGREDRVRLDERLGLASAARPPGPLVWLHAASVGESLALLPLADHLAGRVPPTNILFTSGTVTSAKLIAGRLPPGAVHQYAPLDTPSFARAFIDHWRPRLAILVESELWPNLILAARDGGARTALISANLSDASARRWARAPRSFATLLGAFDLVLARDEASARRLASLGARVDGLADLKYGAPPLPVDESALAWWRERTASRTVLVAASTHPGEEDIVLEAFAGVARHASRPLLILVPRHPDRGAVVAGLAAKRGLATRRRSLRGDVDSAEVLVGDTLGEMGLWYRLAHLAVIGGSFVPGVGGHNPFEPARLGRPFVAGPHTDRWPVYQELQRLGGARLVEGDLAELFLAAANSSSFAGMADRARRYVAAGDQDVAGAFDRVMDLIDR